MTDYAANRGLTPDELLSTTRAVRKRLDLNRPVPRGVVEECLRLAFQAPTGSDSQGWSWVFVDAPDLRAKMAALYRASFDTHARRDQTGESPRPPANPRISESVQYLKDNIHRVPVLLVATIDSRYGNSTTLQQAAKWGSILPAVWSFMLALRSRGLGSAWTTIHLHHEAEMAELLGIPYPQHTQAGLFPVAYTLGMDFKAADRSRSEDRFAWNGWPGLRPAPQRAGRD